MSTKKVIKFKNIKLLPTFQTLDVWVCSDAIELAPAFVKRYGASFEYYSEELDQPKARASVRKITGTIKSEVKGAEKIVLILSSFNHAYIMHEIIHIISFLSEITGIEYNNKSDEWCAYMSEYIFNEITNYKTYSNYEMY